MTNNRRELTADELGHAISLLLACIWSEADLAAWGQAHASAFSAIAESHPDHYAAARDAYARRLAKIRSK